MEAEAPTLGVPVTPSAMQTFVQAKAGYENRKAHADRLQILIALACATGRSLRWNVNCP
jgi:hypothetical protein